MKKNMMVIGMLVALLTIPANMFAQEAVSSDTTLAVSEAAPVKVEKEKKVREPRVQVIDSTHYSYGSVVSAHFGFGTSGLWASNGTAQLKNTWGFPGFNAGVRYSYFFLNWLGFTTGIDYSTYNSVIKMQGIYANTGMNTNMGYAYEHRLNFTGQGEAQSTWQENEYLGMLEIPVALSFKYKPNKVGLISTLGLKMGFPVEGRYSYKGSLNRTGWSEQFNYLQKGDQYLIANDNYEESFKDYKGVWSVINAEVFGEIGALFQVDQRVDLSVSVYGGYCMNDVNKTNYVDRKDLGFQQLTDRAPQTNLSAMNNYKGMIGTKAIDHINPWNLGIKIGVHIYCGAENDAERAARIASMYKEPETITKMVMVRDTVTLTEVVRDTIEKKVIIRDTIRVADQLAKILDRINIYYKKGDAKSPMIEPAGILDEAAAILVANPKQRVLIKGSASADGNRQFNEMLCENRAQTIAAELRKKGVKKSQIDVLSGVAQDSSVDESRSVVIMPIP